MLAAPVAGSAQLQLAHRVIIHLDLDCFYVQVEQKRLGIPRDIPCAVQQWQGLIAVNYAARAAGITRHMRVYEAKKHCPELHLVHVQTIGHVQPVGTSNAATALAATGSAATTSAAPAADGNNSAAAGVPSPSKGTAAGSAEHAGTDAEVEGSALDRGSSKACLQRYRRASADIMRLLGQLCPGCLLEKASIDEAYLDITQMAMRELAASEQGAAEQHRDAGADADDGAAADSGVALLLSRAGEGSVVLGQGGLQQDIEYDRLAAAGAAIALRLRGEVLAQLGYTASAGIGPNKLLAKIGSAKNKPNQQTVVLPRAVAELMQDLPFGKVKGLGGKLGQQLEQLGVSTAGEAAGLAWETLVKHFGSKARWVFNTVRGIDDEAVTPKDKVKSINSCKSFEPITEVAPLAQWLEVLAAELAERMQEDEAEHQRRPRSLVLQYRGGTAAPGSRGLIPDRSIRGPMPTFSPRDMANAEAIAAAALVLFKRLKPAPWPVVRLALVATEFVDLGGAGAGSGAAMARFLASGNAQQHQQQQQQQQQQERGDPALQSLPQVQQQQKPASARGKHDNQQMRLEQFFRQPKQQDRSNEQHSQELEAPAECSVQQAAQQEPFQDAALQPEVENEHLGGLQMHCKQQQQQQQHGQQQQGQPMHQQLLARPTPPCTHDNVSPAAARQAEVQSCDAAAAAATTTATTTLLSSMQAAAACHLRPVVSSNTVHLPCEPAERLGNALAEASVALTAASPAEQQQPDEADDLLEQVDVAEQARILRDIEIQGMLQRNQQKIRGAYTASSKKRPSEARQQQQQRVGNKKQDTKQGGKQMSISAMFGGRGSGNS